MSECSVQEAFENNVGSLADVCCGPSHICPGIPVRGRAEITATNAVEDRLEGFPELFVRFRVDSQLRG